MSHSLICSFSCVAEEEEYYSECLGPSVFGYGLRMVVDGVDSPYDIFLDTMVDFIFLNVAVFCTRFS